MNIVNKIVEGIPVQVQGIGQAMELALKCSSRQSDTYYYVIKSDVPSYYIVASEISGIEDVIGNGIDDNDVLYRVENKEFYAHLNEQYVKVVA